MDRRVSTTTKLTATPNQRIDEIRWARPGPIAVSESPEHVPSTNVTFDGFTVNATIPGAGPTTVVLKKNGTVIATVTVDSGTPYAHVAIKPGVRLIGRVDKYSIAVTQEPTSGEDLSGAIEIGGGADSPQGGGIPVG